MFEIKKYPEMTWSISRKNMFNNCKRKYYYHYYGSHNAWLDDATEEIKWAWRLKKLQNIYALFGDSLHNTIKKTIQVYREYGQLITKDKIHEHISNKLNETYYYSKNHIDKWKEKPNKYPMLFEFFYDNGLKPKTIFNIKERIQYCIDNIFIAESFTNLLNIDNKIVELDEEDFRYILYNECKLFAKLDAFYIDNNTKRFVIIDWKTGKEEERSKEQLLFYALYVIKKYNVDIKNIEIINEYLLQGKCKKYSFNEEELMDFKESIKLSINEMNNFVVDSFTNQPKDIEAFKANPNYKCCNCNFLKLCEYGQKNIFGSQEKTL